MDSLDQQFYTTKFNELSDRLDQLHTDLVATNAKLDTLHADDQASLAKLNAGLNVHLI